MRPITTTGSFVNSLSEERPTLRHLASIRWGMLLAALLLTAIGLATVHSAGTGQSVDYLPRQALWVGLGLLVLVLTFVIDYRVLLGLSLPLYLLGLVALALVLAAGHQAGGSRSWIRLGVFGGQPSEFAKLATALLLARLMSGASPRYLPVRQILLAAAIVGAPMLLIVLQPDLGGAAMFAPILGAVILVGGIRPKIVLGALLAVAVVLPLAWNFGLRPYQKERVLTFVRPERDPLGAGYQVRQSKIAVGSGQMLGKGYRQGTQSQQRFLPARHTDFILAVVAEEWGFTGVVVTLALFLLFLWDGARVAARARDRAGVFLVVALLAPLAFHTVYNSAMVIGWMPNTGIPLPFLSYGGSFTLYCFAATGMILGVDLRRYVNR